MDPLLDLPDEYMHWKCFALAVTGVTRRNEDGESRQAILRYCSEEDPVLLAREPDNKHDRIAIAVLSATGHQIGWIPAGDYSLAMHIDRGGKVSAKILRITGGPDSDERDYFGCVLEIAKYVPDPSKLTIFHDEAYAIKDLIANAKSREKASPHDAIDKYWEAMERIKALYEHPVGRRLWIPKHPLNRLTLLLDRVGRFVDLVNVIKWWEASQLPLPLADKTAVNRRLERVRAKCNMR